MSDDSSGINSIVADMLKALEERADGVVGASVAISTVAKHIHLIDPMNALPGAMAVLAFLERLDLRGSYIWLWYKDICGQSPLWCITLMRAVQLGLVDPATVRAKIHSARLHPTPQIDFDDLICKIRGELGTFAPGV